MGKNFWLETIVVLGAFGISLYVFKLGYWSLLVAVIAGGVMRTIQQNSEENEDDKDN